ncbi:MAG TPA: sulfur carrier protein ThiS [Thermoanaerobaculia bacterium]|nr:sulfur carrier protein ThiS [Thermoanaerobaculia bacterium]
MPEILLNGEAREVAAGATVRDLLDELGRHPRTVAVEHNGDILPRERYGATALAQGDRLEIVGFVQGGGPGPSRGILPLPTPVLPPCRAWRTSGIFTLRSWAASSTGRAADS